MEDTTILRIVVREIHTKAILEKLGKDIVMAYEILNERHGTVAEPEAAPQAEEAAKERPRRRRMSLIPGGDAKVYEEQDLGKATGTGKADEETFSSVC